MPFMKSSIGDIHATGNLGTLELEPRNEELGHLVAEAEVTQLRLIAEVTEPLAVCRLLLKIGLEQLGKSFYEVSVSERVRAAREFARRPKPGDGWWFLVVASPTIA